MGRCTRINTRCTDYDYITRTSAAPAVLVDLATIQVDPLVHLGIRLIHLHVRPDLLAHCEEGVFHVAALFGTGLQELHSQGVSHFLPFLVGNLSLFFQVAFVAHHQLDHVLLPAI